MSIQRQTPLSFSFYFFWMSFSPPSHLLSALFKMTTNVSVHTLQATDGYCSGDTRLRLGVMVVDFFFLFGGGRGYLLFKRPRHSHGTTQPLPQKDGCWLPVEEPSRPASLSLPPPSSFFCFLLIDPPTSKKNKKQNLFLSPILSLTISSTCLILFVFCCLCHTKR